ncbi:MAG: dimethyl sulfoxide reductase anchor subunit family protein [Oceanibaculum sp.]
MNPAFSVIFFTTASGAGYGLIALFGIGAMLGLLPDDRWFGGISLGVALALVSAGLLSSTFHLGHPERAWRAFSQWRTSWLSREGVLAVLTFVPAGLLWLVWVLCGPGIWTMILGPFAAALALATVWATAMIYASLKPIHQWHNKWVLPNYLAMALFTGGVLLYGLLHLWGPALALAGEAALVAGLIALTLKRLYWNFIDRTQAESTPETATGLGHLGKVRLFEAPHTESNYLLKEMGFKVGRKHAAKLRRMTLIAGFYIPILLTMLALTSAGQSVAVASSLLSILSVAIGILAERWLFFAEAKHTVTLYYGAERV